MQQFVNFGQYEYGKGYNSGQTRLERAADGRRISVIENEQFKLTDEFDGGNPYCGIARLARKSDNHVIWNSYYHGWLTREAASNGYAVADVFNFLREALQKPDQTTIGRGPREFKSAEFTYANKPEFGDFACYYGYETIHNADGVLLYYGRYGGGLVDLAEDSGEA